MSKIRHQHESSDPHIAFLAMRETLREENLEKSKKERQKREEAAELRHQQHLSEIEEKARRTVRQPVPPSRSPRSEDEFYAKEEQRRNRYVIDVHA
jgi:5'-3' exonuclease